MAGTLGVDAGNSKSSHTRALFRDPLRQHVWRIMASYDDLNFSCLDSGNTPMMRDLYALHAVNHVVKSRKQIITNNKRVKAQEGLDDVKDQGGSGSLGSCVTLASC